MNGLRFGMKNIILFLKEIKSLIDNNQKDILFDDLNKINLIREILSGIKIK